MTDQHSLSDAEDFTEGYRTLKLGPVVGEPTAGWIIYTSNVNLIDGSSLRLPSTVIGLLFHAAEHTQRHMGQMVTTAKFVRASAATVESAVTRALANIPKDRVHHAREVLAAMAKPLTVLA